MSLRRLLIAPLCLLAIAALLTGCGGGDSDSTAADQGESRPAPPKANFPQPEGRSLLEIVNGAEVSEAIASPAALAFHKGKNRYPFGVFSVDRKQIVDAEVALYISKTPTVTAAQGEPGSKKRKGAVARAKEEALNAPALGPFPAKIESLVTQAAFRARTTSEDPGAATVVYVADLNFPSEGEWRIAALIKQDGKTSATLLSSADVGLFTNLPRVGDKAPVIDTPTAAEVNDLAEITTRIPPDTQNRVNFADVVGKEPVVLLFATPQFCRSRVCGPVVDVAEQVKETSGDDAAFIHMEIFNENDPNKGPRPQVREFNLPSEPWLFVIDENGIIRSAVEGAFGIERLTEALEGVTGSER